MVHTDIRYCKQCGELLVNKRQNALFCSDNCGKRYSDKNHKHVEMIRTCVICEKSYERKKYSLHNTALCSDECRKINKRQKQNERQRTVRRQFREKYGISTGGSNSVGLSFVYSPELLDSNPVLLETLQLITKMKKMERNDRTKDPNYYKEQGKIWREKNKDKLKERAGSIDLLMYQQLYRLSNKN